MGIRSRGLGRGKTVEKPWRMALGCWGCSCTAILQKALVPEAVPSTAEGGKRGIAWIKYVLKMPVALIRNVNSWDQWDGSAGKEACPQA